MTKDNSITLQDFVQICKETSKLDTKDYFFIDVIKNKITDIEVLTDFEKCMETYYFWLLKAQTQELFDECVIIVKAKLSEIKYYRQLLKNKNNDVLDIIENNIKLKYLGDATTD